MASTKADTDTKAAPDCKACGDTFRVNLRLLGQDGEIFREVPCPECGPGVRLADPGQIITRDDLEKLLTLAIMALALAAVAFLLSVKGHKPSSPFAEAVKEVKETVQSE